MIVYVVVCLLLLLLLMIVIFFFMFFIYQLIRFKKKMMACLLVMGRYDRQTVLGTYDQRWLSAGILLIIDDLLLHYSRALSAILLL